MMGMCATTGKTVDGANYLRQRLTNALTTSVGTTTMLRERGCRLADLVDAPANGATMVDVYSAIAEALQSPLAGVPDFRLSAVDALGFEDGALTLALTGETSAGRQTVEVTL